MTEESKSEQENLRKLREARAKRQERREKKQKQEEEEAAMITHFSSLNTTDADGGMRPRKKRRILLALSFLILVLCPIFLSSFYYLLVATDRYISSAGFAVRGVVAGSGADVVGAFTGLASSGSTNSDSYIILKYLKSRDILERLQEDFPIRQAYSHPQVDPLSRMRPNLTMEEFGAYWDRRIKTSFDAHSGIIRFEIQAFTPQDARHIADLLLGYTRDLVNRLSENARQDSVRFAEAEVAHAEARLREALQDIRLFREQEQSLNPTASAQLQIELISALERQMIDIRARMAALGQSVDANAPMMSALRRQAEALEAQITERTKGIAQDGTGTGAALSGLLATYEALEVERDFAQQAYASALSSLERARVEADRQQRYLAVYSTPALAEEAVYPRRLLNILMLALAFTALWGIGTLIIYSVRDHLS